jgi:signal transduction histidine kinase
MARESSRFRSFKQADTRLVLLIAASLVVLVGYLVFTTYRGAIQHSKTEVLNRLRAVAFTSAYLIDGDQHDSLVRRFKAKDAIRTNEDDAHYARMQSTLAMVQQANKLETPVYTLFFHTPDSTFRFAVTSSPYPYFRHVYRNYPKAMLEQLESGGVLDVYEDENGIWLSAFAPIRNRVGRVVALIQADEHFESFLGSARQELLTTVLLSLLLTIPFAFLLLRYVSVNLTKREEARKLLQEQNEEIQTQNEVIKKNQMALEKARAEVEAYSHTLEEKVKARTRALKKSNDELSQFLYHSSHDIQAPLATLKGLIALLPNDANVFSVRDHLQRTVEKMDRIVKTLQAIHRVKTKKPDAQAIELESLFNQIVQKLNGAKPPELSWRNRVAGILLETDAEILELAMLEVIRNSFQYAHPQEIPWVEVTAFRDKNDMIIEVTDNGTGIPTDVQDRLFDVFFRGNDRSTGIGIGLKIAHIGLTRLGGKISSIPVLVGSKFRVQLPIDPVLVKSF